MSSQRNAGNVGNNVHLHTPAFTGGRSLHPQQRLGQAPISGFHVVKASLGPSGFGGNFVAAPLNLSSPPVLTAAVSGGIGATRSSLFHV
jgi:hypothetical protein